MPFGYVENMIPSELNQSTLASELARIGKALAAKSQPIGGGLLEQTCMTPVSFDRVSSDAIDSLRRKFSLSSFDLDLLLLCFGVDILSSWPVLCGSVAKDLRKKYVTFDLALSVLDDPQLSALSSYAPLRRWGLIKIEPDIGFFHSRIAIDRQIFFYLLDIKYCSPDLLNIISPLEIQAYLTPSHLKISRKILTQWIRTTCKSSSLVQLVGKDLASKKAVAKVVSSGMGFKLYSTDARSLLEPKLDLSELAYKITRESILNDIILLLNCEELAQFNSRQKFRIRTFINYLECPLIITGRDSLYFEGKDTITKSIELPSRAEQKIIWKECLKNFAPELDGHLDRIVNQFSFSSPAIFSLSKQLKNLNRYDSNNRAGNEENLDGSNINERLSNRHDINERFTISLQKGHNSNGHDSLSQSSKLDREEENETGKNLWGICRAFARPRLGELAARIESKVSWSDLILGDRERKTLLEIMIHVRQRSKVYEDWGMGLKSKRGLGISALFAGSSGTGKTLAAEVLANELNLDIYRIDLSTLVSKYIGETEKNLRKIFDRAEGCGVILLFDEADAIFGRRSEVRDSHDRYANLEISYLLQRIETYQGLAILTTNLKQDIDRAFLRRIRFIVNFEFPNDDMREAIWRGIFPKQTPTKDLDYKKLANLCMNGGDIRNIAIKAAFHAADEGESVQMKHILKATYSECYKLHRLLSDREIKGWVSE